MPVQILIDTKPAHENQDGAWSQETILTFSDKPERQLKISTFTADGNLITRAAISRIDPATRIETQLPTDYSETMFREPVAGEGANPVTVQHHHALRRLGTLLIEIDSFYRNTSSANPPLTLPTLTVGYVSISHLSNEVTKWLDANYSAPLERFTPPNNGILTGGWIIPTDTKLPGEDDASDFDDGDNVIVHTTLRPLLEAAIAQNLDYIIFDANAPQVGALKAAV